ncbi:MAG TPA: glycosyltransferase family 39 protein [Clostridia bacterium]
MEYLKEKSKFLIYTTFVVFLFLLTFTALFFRARYNMYLFSDAAKIVHQKTVLLILSSLLMLALLILFIKFSSKLDRFRSIILIPVVLMCSLTIQVFFILKFPTCFSADQEAVYYAAIHFLQSNFSAFQKGGYLYMYPNNIGITLFFAFLYSFLPHSIMVPKLFNVLFSLVTSFMIYLIYNELNSNNKRNYGILILSCLFLPSILLNNFIYNDICSTTMFTCAVYFAIRFVRSQKISSIILASIFVSVGFYLRNVGIIFVIAMVLYFIFNSKSIKKTIPALLIMLLMLQVPILLSNSIIESKGIVKEPVGANSAPVLMWVNIGIPTYNLGFWDDGKSYYQYTKDSNWNKSKSTEIFKHEIAKKFSNSDILRLLKTYYEKIFWTWTEGTYESEYYGLGYNSIGGGYLYKTSLNQFLEDGSIYRSALMWVIYIFNFLMLCMIGFNIFDCLKKRDFSEELPVLIILGFVTFYLIWEVKSRYIYPCYPYMIILSFKGLHNLIRKITL